DSLQQRAGVKNGDDPITGIGAAALHHFAFARNDAPVAAQAQLQLDVGLRTRAMGQKVLLPRKPHHYLSLGGMGEERGDDLEIEAPAARPEAAADERLDHTNA